MTYPQIGKLRRERDDVQADEPALARPRRATWCATSNWRSAQACPTTCVDHGVVASRAGGYPRARAPCARLRRITGGRAVHRRRRRGQPFCESARERIHRRAEHGFRRCRARVRAASRPTTCRLRRRSRSPRLLSRASKWSPTTAERSAPSSKPRARRLCVTSQSGTPGAEVLTMAPDLACSCRTARATPRPSRARTPRSNQRGRCPCSASARGTR